MHAAPTSTPCSLSWSARSANWTVLLGLTLSSTGFKVWSTSTPLLLRLGLLERGLPLVLVLLLVLVGAVEGRHATRHATDPRLQRRLPLSTTA